MNALNVSILNRDFTTPPIKPLVLNVDRLTWSAFGGPDQANLSAYAPIEKLFEYVSMLRCPVTVSDAYALPVWWGFISKITVLFEHSIFTIDLEELFNRVNLKYSFLSPDNKLADQYETGYRGNELSAGEYGIREKVLYRQNIDDHFAENLRDTFLELSAFPRSVLSSSQTYATPQVMFYCQGWFHTFSWRSYEHLDGFYANYGPGPGFCLLGSTANTAVAQPFTVKHNQSVKYVYALIRKIGTPSNNLTAHIYSNSASNTPQNKLGSSEPFNGTALEQQRYTWVKFTFTDPVALSASTKYWAYFNPSSTSNSNHYHLRTDETSSFDQIGNNAKILISGTWKGIGNITTPGLDPDLYFRVICVEDTGKTLFDVASAGSQFLTAVHSFTTGVSACPYRFDGYSCHKELIKLMELGTDKNRLVLAYVTPERRLMFYEQPDPNLPTAFMNSKGQFFTAKQQLLPPWFPPMGQFAQLSSVDRLIQPFDKARTPSCFVDKVEYRPSSAQL